jgi:hypothetical protein
VRGGGCPRIRHIGRTGRRSAGEGRGPLLGHSAETPPTQQIYRTPALALNCILQCFRSTFFANPGSRFIAPCRFVFRSRPECGSAFQKMRCVMKATCVLITYSGNEFGIQFLRVLIICFTHFCFCTMCLSAVILQVFKNLFHPFLLLYGVFIGCNLVKGKYRCLT